MSHKVAIGKMGENGCFVQVRRNLASFGMRFLNLMITPILWLAFFHSLLISTFKLRPQSIVTPRSFNFSDSIISLPLTVIHILECAVCSLQTTGCVFTRPRKFQAALDVVVTTT